MKSNSTHILLVEDDPLEVANLKRIFHVQGIGNSLHVAVNEQQALDMLQGRGRPALHPVPYIILFAMKQPETGNYGFIKYLRQDPLLRACSIYILTAQRSEQDIQAAYDLNVAGYIIKPSHTDSYQEIIATLTSFWNLIELPN